MSQERLVAEIDEELKELLKTDPRPIKKIVTSSLQREFQTKEKAAIRRRIDEQKQRITSLEREINDRESELAKAKDELERLESLLERQEEQQEDNLQKAVDVLSDKPPSVLQKDSQPVQFWADELGMTPETLIEKIEEKQ